MAKIIGQSCGAVDADDLDACGRCFTCRRSQQLLNEQQADEQPEHPDVIAETWHGTRFHSDGSTSQREASPFGPVQRWGMLPQQDATTCDSTPDGPACDWDPSCPTHGILGG